MDVSEILKLCGELPPFGEDAIKAEPTLFASSPEFARAKGGEITRAILDLAGPLAPETGHVVIDTRVHKLRPGWFPASPGWHLDAIERDSDGQPDLTAPRVDYHLLSIVDCGTGSTTEFLASGAVPDLPVSAPEGHSLWDVHDRRINQLGRPETCSMSSHALYRMHPDAYHRARPATGSGWRYFFRATVGSPRPPANEIHQQSNVYVLVGQTGW